MHAHPARILTLAAAALPALAFAAAPNMKEGLWEVTTKVEMAGMPGGMPPQVVRQCITKKDLQDPRSTTPGSGPSNSNCKVTDYKVQGNTASWNMACTGEAAMTGTGTVTYSGTSYTGTNKMTMKQGGQTQTVTMQYSARHVGDCAK